MLTVQYAMVKAGLKPGDASFVGVGGGASGVAAMKKGEIDAISHDSDRPRAESDDGWRHRERRAGHAGSQPFEQNRVR